LADHHGALDLASHDGRGDVHRSHRTGCLVDAGCCGTRSLSSIHDVGKLFLVGWSFAFFFHAANGIRHLAWDTGRGFDKRHADRSAWVVVGFAAIASAVFWWVAT
jgi:succinate dehydrogenase cytochrome b556 subunit